MKKYQVSLALKIPCNFELEVKARSKKEALDKAIGMFNEYGYNEDYATESDYANTELDINTEVSINHLGNGIVVEEIEQ